MDFLVFMNSLKNHNLDSFVQRVFFGEGFEEVTLAPQIQNTPGPNGQRFGLWALGLRFSCFSSFRSKMLPHTGLGLDPNPPGPRARP